MCTCFNTKTDIAENLIDDFFCNFDCQRTFPKEGFYVKKIEGTGLISEKTEVLYAELDKRMEATTCSYSVTGDSLQYVYSVPVTKNRQDIQSRCLVHEFSFTNIF